MTVIDIRGPSSNFVT